MPIVNGPSDEPSARPSPDELVRAGKAAALGELTSSIAHELNNPLLALIGLVDFLVAEAEPGSREHRRLGVVRETALEMRAILRAVADFTRDSAEGDGGVDLGATVRRTLDLVRRASSPKDVELVERVPPDQLLVVGRGSEIGQAVLHLLANALAAAPGGGRVTVEVERNANGARVTVADSGDGVPAELAERIFEPFFSTRDGGSGLGLAAARAIAERHGGTLEVDPGGGATFVLTLPLAEGAPEP